ncbi:MAG: primosomal protein N' [Bacilli bacterium]
MFFLVKVLIGRAVVSLDRPFSYYTEDDTIEAGQRVLVSFGMSKSTIGFVLEKPIKIEMTLEEYQQENGIHLAQIQKKVDDFPILNEDLIELAKRIAQYYKADLIKVLSSFLPPSLKPRNSALKKTQGKTATFAMANPQVKDFSLTKNEKKLYDSIALQEEGLRTVHITAKASLKSLIEKEAVILNEVPISRIPKIEGTKSHHISLTDEQQEVMDTVLNGEDKPFLLEGVTGSGKTEVYLKLADEYLKNNKGVLILIPEIALTDQMADLFSSYFRDSVSILNSSLSYGRKYDEYKRIAQGETKIVLGTRSAIFAPVTDLGLIIIDEEHSSSYKQDNVPFYDAIKVALLRRDIQHCRVLLGSATPRIIDKARAMKNIYTPLYMKTRYAKNQEHELTLINMNNSDLIDINISSYYSKPLIEEIKRNLQSHQQTMILLNRRGYSPVYLCRKCHSVAKCPNCNIPLNYHKRDDTLRCHHCGYKVNKSDYTCSCKSHEFLELGYGTERAYEELRFLFPESKIYRLDSDVSSNDTRHEILSDFSKGEADILVGTQVIAKGHDFPRVTLAAILDADFSLRLPTYLANEETFDLISQFVGRAGRGDLKGRIMIQTYVPDNKVISLASHQQYQEFFDLEMEERRKYQYPPYTYLTSIIIKAVDSKKSFDVADKVKEYLLDSCAGKRINIYGPSSPYIPHANGRYYRSILLKYKSLDEISPILDGIKTIRLANKDCEILINVDPGKENL